MNWKKLSLIGSAALAVITISAGSAQAQGRGQGRGGSNAGAQMARPSGGGSFSQRGGSGGGSIQRGGRGGQGSFRGDGNRWRNGNGNGRWSNNNGNRWHHRHHRHHRRGFYGGFYPYGYGYPFGYGYGFGYPYFGSSAALYYNGYRPQYASNGGNLVVDVQRELAQGGFYRGPIDGVIGNGTRSAIRAYERANGLRVDGRIDDRLLNTMGLS